MITQTTRRASYDKIKQSLGKRQIEVWQILKNYNKPMSAWEISSTLGRDVYVVRPRITELAHMGVIEACGTVFCNHTGRSEAVWKLKPEPEISGQMNLF